MIIVSVHGIFEILASADEHGRATPWIFTWHCRDVMAYKTLQRLGKIGAEGSEAPVPHGSRETELLFEYLLNRLHYVDSVAAEAARIHGAGSPESSAIHRVANAVWPMALVRDDGWKDISTAPKDGAQILAWTSYGVFEIVTWCRDRACWQSAEGVYFGADLWKPLKPPAQADPTPLPPPQTPMK